MSHTKEFFESAIRATEKTLEEYKKQLEDVVVEEAMSELNKVYAGKFFEYIWGEASKNEISYLYFEKAVSADKMKGFCFYKDGCGDLVFSEQNFHVYDTKYYEITKKCFLRNLEECSNELSPYLNIALTS